MSKRNPAPRPVALPSIREKLEAAENACKYWFEIVNDPAWSSGKITALQEIINDAQNKISKIQDAIQRGPTELAKFQTLVADLTNRLGEDRRVKAIPHIQKTMTGLKKNLSFLENLKDSELAASGISQQQLDAIRALVNGYKI